MKLLINFVCRLRKRAKNCSFDKIDDYIRDQVVENAENGAQYTRNASQVKNFNPPISTQGIPISPPGTPKVNQAENSQVISPLTPT